MPSLIPVEAVGEAAFPAALQRVWERGDAVLPVDPRLPAPARAAALDALGVGRPVQEGDALVVATSGTTGAPKGVVLTHDAVRASALATSRRIGADPAHDHWLACLPLAHVGGLSVVTRALVTGIPLTLLPRFDAAAVEASPATLVSLVPTALARVDPSRFRVVLLGGSAPPAGLPANVVVTYGMTETGSGVVYDGVPLDGVEVRVAADGEVLVRGPMLLRCYRDGSDPKDGDGWLPTGDAGEVGADGRLHVHGRLGDVIVSGGEKVWPAPVEAVLRTHPGVADATVVGRPDPDWGEAVVALVVPADPASPPSLDALRSWVKEHLPAFAAPRRVVLVDDVGRTPLGKRRREPGQPRPTRR